MPETIYLSSGAGEADINAALASLTDGGTVVLPEDETITITAGLRVDIAAHDVTIDLNGGTLVQGGNVKVITANGSHDPSQAVSLTHADGDLVVTYGSAPTGVGIGDWIKIFSDDAVPGDHIDAGDNGQPTRLGQAVQVVAIDGNQVTVAGDLVDAELYTTNVRASTYNSATFVLENGTISGDQSQSWAQYLVEVRSAIAPVIENVSVIDNNTGGINIVDSVDARVVDSIASNLKDDGSLGYYGIAVHSAASLRTTVEGLYAEHLRHAVDDNCVGVAPGAANVSQYGADIALTARDVVAYETSAPSFSWHSEGIDGLYERVMSFDSPRLATFRGMDNTLRDSGAVGMTAGLQFYEYGDGDGRGMLAEDLVVREMTGEAVTVSNEPVDNVVRDSRFESYGAGYEVSPAAVNVTDTIVAKNVVGDDDVLTGTGHFDLMLGGKGVDTLSGGGGGDYVWGGAGVDRLTGGAGLDRFAWHDVAEGGDVVTDFSLADDLVDVSVLAARNGWERTDPLATGDLRVVQSGSDTLVQALDAGNWQTLATLLQVSALGFTAANVQVLPSAYTYDPGADRPDNPPLVGTGQGEYVYGSPLVDNDNGGGGSDTMFGRDGADLLNGGDGNDFVYGQAGDDALYGTGGDDRLDGDIGIDRLYGDTGIDSLFGGNGGDTLDGGSEDDKLYGGADDDKLLGRAGNDFIDSGAGADKAYGSDGIDTIYGRDGNDQLYGEAGNDLLFGEGGDDVQYGAVGDDRLDGGIGVDRLYGSTGIDALFGGDGADTLDGGTEDDKLYGGADIDTLTGGTGNDRLEGGAGADLTYGGAGADVTYGGDDGDRLAGGTEADALYGGTGIDNLTGDDGNDYLDGGDDNDKVYGGTGDDKLFGGAGDDYLTGGTGADRLTGGDGNDTLVLASSPLLADGGAGNDVLQVSGTISFLAGTVAGIETFQVAAGGSLDGSNLSAVMTASLLGSAGIVGTAFGDRIAGSSGADRIEGAAGGDTLTGNAGADTYVFRAGFGVDVVRSFSGPDSDVVEFHAGTFTNFDDVLAHASQVGLDTVIALDASNKITLAGVAIGSLAADDFLFL